MLFWKLDLKDSFHGISVKRLILIVHYRKLYWKKKKFFIFVWRVGVWMWGHEPPSHPHPVSMWRTNGAHVPKESGNGFKIKITLSAYVQIFVHSQPEMNSSSSNWAPPHPLHPCASSSSSPPNQPRALWEWINSINATLPIVCCCFFFFFCWPHLKD